MRNSIRVLFASVFCIIVLSGCTARLNQFKVFADAGKAYVQAEKEFIAAARDVAIDADSAILTRTRPDLPAADLGKDVLTSNKLMAERIELLRNIEEHSQLLNAYFETISKLATSDAPEEIGTASADLVTALGKVSAKIKSATINGTPISSVVDQTVQLAVQAYQVGVLDSVLKKHAPMIAGELQLHEQVLGLLSDAYKQNVQELLNLEITNKVNIPYKDQAKPLPSTWAQQRREILLKQTTSAAGDAAVSASTKLQKNFKALVEGKFDLGDLESMIADLDKVVSLAQSIRGVK